LKIILISSGLQETVYSIGFDAGSTLMGVLFHALGTRLTLLLYSISTAVLLVTLLLYIRFSKYEHDYEKLAQDSDIE
jgi:predicted MFS family arabinose efflux permease